MKNPGHIEGNMQAGFVYLFMFQNMQWGDALHIAVMVMYKFNSYS